MWVTQTYLGHVEPDANLFVYYFFENYSCEQKTFTKQVQQELEKLGEVFGDKVSLLMPNPRYAGKIEAEVRRIRYLWESLRGNLPGLFVSRKPLKSLQPTDDGCIYVPFETRDPANAAIVIQRVRCMANETISWDFTHRLPPERPSFGERFGEAIELKPGIFGFRIDLKKLARRE